MYLYPNDAMMFAMQTATPLLLAAISLAWTYGAIYGAWLGGGTLLTRLLVGGLIAAAGVIIARRQVAQARRAAQNARLPQAGVYACAVIMLLHASAGAYVWLILASTMPELPSIAQRPKADRSLKRCPSDPASPLPIGPVRGGATPAQLSAALDQQYQEALRTSDAAMLLEQARTLLLKQPPCPWAGSAIADLRRTRDPAALPLLLRTLCLPEDQRPCVTDEQLLRALRIFTGKQTPPPAPDLCQRLVVGWWKQRKDLVDVDLSVFSPCGERLLVTAALRLDEPRFQSSSVGGDLARTWSAWHESGWRESSAHRGLLSEEMTPGVGRALLDLTCDPVALRSTNYSLERVIPQGISLDTEETVSSPRRRFALLMAEWHVYTGDSLPLEKLWRFVEDQKNERWIRVAAATALQYAAPAEDATSRARGLLVSDDVELRAAALYALRGAPTSDLLPRVEQLLLTGSSSEALAGLALLMYFKRDTVIPLLNRVLLRLGKAPRKDALVLVAAQIRDRFERIANSKDLRHTPPPTACDAIAHGRYMVKSAAPRRVIFGEARSAGASSNLMDAMERTEGGAMAQLLITCKGWDLFALESGRRRRVGRYDFDTRVLWWRGAQTQDQDPGRR